MAPALLLAVLALVPQERDGLVASPEAGWPQWRGPRRDGISGEKGLLQEWPEGGPKRLWKTDGLGQGWSSPIIAGDRLYITGDAGADLVIYAFDLEGKPVWKATNGRSWADPYPGARACPVYSEGKLYHLNAHGRLACLDAATGRELWTLNVLEKFEGSNITWALSECLLVDGAKLFVTPGGRKGLMAALDKATGSVVWTSEPLPGDLATYTSPLLVRQGGRKMLINASSGHGFAVDAETGKILWKVELKNQYGTNVSTPAYADGQVHFATAFFVGGAYRMRDGGVDPAWKTPLDTCTGSFVVADGVLYGGGYTRFKSWIAVDWKTGETRASLKELRTGAAIWADGRLYCAGEDGRVALVTPLSEGFKIVGQFRLTDARVHDAWTHPVLLDGRLYVRYHDTLYCLDVKK